MIRLTIFVVAFVGVSAWCGTALPAASPSEREKSSSDHEEQVRSLFAQHCVACHGSEESNGGLRLDDSKGLFAEADSGERAVVPHQPDSSEILARVRSRNEDDQMPPEGERLSPKDVKLIEAWINQGAPWSAQASDTETSTPETDHWAFQPIRSVPVPSVRETSWPRNEIDRFIQSSREQARLQAADDASPVTMLRRIKYTLTGLPPTIEEVDAFESQVEHGGLELAVAAAVDDFLSRPSYGQRWGRHWMDWVRYADTAGDNSDYPIPQAYLYRNYIIDSLNEDLPYARFLTEQIAGDLLPAESLEQRNRQTIATGYLAMARRFGSLVERYPWHLTIEDTIDNVGRTMMGMTLACARCHDHKFDPVSTRDYYGLYGIFSSTRYPFPGIELFKAQRDFVSLLDESETRAKLAKFQPETDKLVKQLRDHLERCEVKARENAVREKECTLAEKRKMRDELDGMLIKARRAGETLAKHLKTLPEIPTAYAVGEASPIDAAIQIKGEPTRPGATVPRGFPEILGGWKLDDGIGNASSGRKELASWITHPDNPLTARVIVNRVWQRHFGTGIVPSTSDFGLRGQLPTHPELLDWLASDFIRNGWSLKHLHRKILTSRTYAMSSNGPAQNHEVDPANKLYWRFQRSRLDAESIRDTLMAIAGTLDRTPQTKPYPFPPRDQWSFTQHHPFKDDYQSNKRSVYLLTKRLTAKPYFQTFDGPDPNVCTSDRDQSVTALQALYFVNDQFLHEQSMEFSEKLLRNHRDPRGRLDHAFLALLSRRPNDEETDLLMQHLESLRSTIGDGPNAERQAWASVVRSLFRLNEFLYLD